MTTHSENTATINFPIEKVHETLATKAYWEFEVERIGDEPGEVNSFSDNPAIEAVLFETLPTAALPEAVRSMVSQALKLKRTVVVNGLVDDSATGTIVAEVKGAPVKFESQVEMKKADETTQLVVESAVDVNIPMMGSVLEPKVAEWIEDFITREASLIEEYIKNN